MSIRLQIEEMLEHLAHPLLSPYRARLAVSSTTSILGNWKKKKR